MKKWERHLFFRVIKTALLILFGIFGIFIVVDLSIHSVRFFGEAQAGICSVALYYGSCFSMHLDLFLALSFLLASVKVLADLGQHSELVALQMAGLSKHKIARPLFLIAIICACISYTNAQWLSPLSVGSIDQFRSKHAQKKSKTLREHVHTVALDDGSEMIYQSFDTCSKRVFDAYWIRQDNQFWHIKSLDLSNSPPIGQFVELFSRTANGQLVLTESFDKRSFADLPLTANSALKKFIPFQHRPLGVLISQSLSPSADVVMVRAHMHYKLSFPLLTMLLAFCICPILMQFSRHRSIFLICGLGLFGFISFLTIIDGMLILAENRVCHPFLALWSPWIFSFAGSCFYFWKKA